MHTITKSQQINCINEHREHQPINHCSWDSIWQDITWTGGASTSQPHLRGGGASDNNRRARAMASDHQYSPSPSRTLGRRATQERVIVELELENEELRKKNEMYRETVEELRGEIGKLMLKGRSKKQLRQSLHHSEADDRYSHAIGKLCRQWLFPRFKFLHDRWMNYTTSRKGLPRMIFARCPIPPASTEVDMWNTVVAPTVARSYANMRCNVNKYVCAAFKGELHRIQFIHY